MVVDLFLVYQFIRRLATPFEKWPAYEAGVIDKDGNILKGKRERNFKSEKDSFGKFDLMLLKLKKLLAKVPGGSSRLASYAAALWLIREWNHFTDESLLNESVSEKSIDRSLELFISRYNHYNTLSEDVNKKMILEAKKVVPPKWKRAGPDGELEIKFPSGRKFLIRKQLDQNLRHERGSFQILEWQRGAYSFDWEWIDTVSPKAYAKETVLGIGMWNKGHTKIIADYSSSMTKYMHTPVTDGKRTINFNEELETPGATTMKPECENCAEYASEFCKHCLEEISEGVNDSAIFKAVFLAGGPGSGKSFIVGKTALTALGMKVVNSDDAFERGLKSAGLEMTSDNIYSPKGQDIRSRAKTLTRIKQLGYLSGRLGMVIDGTGKDYDKIKKQAIDLRRLGYDVAMIFVNTDEATALKRNQMRARSLPDATVSKMWKDVQKNLGSFQTFFGNFFIIDNSEGSDYDKQVLNVYKKMAAWTRSPPKNRAVTSWMRAQKLKEEVGAKDKTPAWKRAGNNGEIEIKFPTGRRFKIEKQFDENDRHRGEWKLMEYKTDSWVDDWEWVDTYKPKGFAKQKAMIMGQYDKKGKKVADYSKTFQYESVNIKTELEEEPANNVGSGNIAGMDAGHMSKAAQKKWTSSNKTKKKRLRDIIGVKI
jgi:shikimate kinase